jgi:hypothetical protein
MPIQKDLKRIVRSRMKKTGESYTAARLQLLKKKDEPKPDLAALGGMKDVHLKKNTGREWSEWVKILDKAGAATMEHGPIAQIVSDMGVPGWWTQCVAVGYERIKGIRARGQRRNGTWEASKSRTFAVPVDKLFDAFQSAAKRKKWLDAKIVVRKATAPKSMRVTWDDGTSVQMWFTPKGEAKSNVAVQHTKLSSKADADRMKVYWGEKLDALNQALGLSR